MESINVYPVLATWKKSKKTGMCPLHLSVDIEGKRAAFPSLKIKLLEDQWDAGKKQVKSKVANAALLNGRIAKFSAEISGELMKKQLGGKTLNKELVKKQVKGGKSGLDFYFFCLGEGKEKGDKRIKGQIELQDYEPSTRSTYTSEISKLKKFRASLSFGDIDFTFLQEYANYMREELGNSDNTVWKSFKFLNTMLNLAIDKGEYTGDNPFKNFDRGRYKQGIPEYLEWPEVEKLHKAITKKDGLTEDLKLTGYYTLLSYYTGLRFGSAVKFTYSKDVIETSKGNRILLYANKNGEIISMEFNKYISEIVEYIKDRPLPVVTNQEFNRRLKLIGMFAGISKPLKTHMGRHSFGMRCAELLMSEEAAQRLLGHSDIASTRIYFRVKDNRTDKEMKSWET